MLGVVLLSSLPFPWGSVFTHLATNKPVLSLSPQFWGCSHVWPAVPCLIFSKNCHEIWTEVLTLAQQAPFFTLNSLPSRGRATNLTKTQDSFTSVQFLRIQWCGPGRSISSKLSGQFNVPGPSHHRERNTMPTGLIWILEAAHFPRGCVTPAPTPSVSESCWVWVRGCFHRSRLLCRMLGQLHHITYQALGILGQSPTVICR